MDKDNHEKWMKQFHFDFKSKHPTNGPSTSGLKPFLHSSIVNGAKICVAEQQYL